MSEIDRGYYEAVKAERDAAMLEVEEWKEKSRIAIRLRDASASETARLRQELTTAQAEVERKSDLHLNALALWRESQAEVERLRQLNAEFNASFHGQRDAVFQAAEQHRKDEEHTAALQAEVSRLTKRLIDVLLEQAKKETVETRRRLLEAESIPAELWEMRLR